MLLVVLFACNISTVAANDTATIHGAIYDWDSFSLLENVIVEVNSTPSQSILAKYGVYSFNLPTGNYLISASYYSNYTLISYTEEEITISDNGDYVLDLILLPMYGGVINESEFAELDEIAAMDSNNSKFLTYLIVIFAILMGIGSYLYFGSRNKNISETFATEDDMNEFPNPVATPGPLNNAASQLPDDLQEMLKVIESSGGRITQKELRSKVRYSEAKVSLMVSDLENRGFVHKFKKGRGNVIVLEGYEQVNQNV